LLSEMCRSGEWLRALSEHSKTIHRIKQAIAAAAEIKEEFYLITSASLLASAAVVSMIFMAVHFL